MGEGYFKTTSLLEKNHRLLQFCRRDNMIVPYVVGHVRIQHSLEQIIRMEVVYNVE